MTVSVIASCQGVCKAVNAVPAPAEVITSVELASVAERATTTKPEALGPRAGGEAEHGHDKAPRDGATEHKCEFKWPLRGALGGRQGSVCNMKRCGKARLGPLLR